MQALVTHLLKSKQVQIAVMPPEEIALEVPMARSALVAWQKFTQELVRLRDSLHDANQALEFEDPLKP